MGRKLYFADPHFGHENVIRLDHRPFISAEEMDLIMIENWQKKIRKDDEVYIVGDFCYRNGKDPEWYLEQLPGKKYLVIGNHDQKMLKRPGIMNYFEDVSEMMHVTDNGRRICRCHFPLCEWNGYYRDSYHIYGHIHNCLSDTCMIMRRRKNAYNAAASINDYTPCTLDEIIINNIRFEKEHPLSWKDLPPVR